jgi:hypothetical protein
MCTFVLRNAKMQLSKQTYFLYPLARSPTLRRPPSPFSLSNATLNVTAGALTAARVLAKPRESYAAPFVLGIAGVPSALLLIVAGSPRSYPHALELGCLDVHAMHTSK